MSNRLPYDWFRDSATSVMARMLIISAVLHVLLIAGLTVWFSRHKAPEPVLINVSLVAAPGPMTPMPGSAGAPPPPPPPEKPGPEQTPPPEQPKPEPPKPEPKPEPPKPEPPKPEPKVEKLKPEPEKPPKPSTKEEKPKKPKKVDLTPVEDPKDEPPKKTPQKTGGKPAPKTKGPTLVGAEPTDNMMPSDVPISMAVGGQGPPTAMGSWPGLFQRQVYMQWLVPNGIPMNDANYLPQITVTLGRDGKILEGPTVTKPSPSDALNESCVQALMNATIPPFPDNYEEPQVTMVVQFSPMGRQSMGGGLPQPSAPAF